MFRGNILADTDMVAAEMSASEISECSFLI